MKKIPRGFWACLFWVSIVALWWAIPSPPSAQSPTKEVRNAQRLNEESKYENWFWQQQKKEPDLYKTIIGKIETSDGKIVTGRLLFISECPKGYGCAQPDESNTYEGITPNELANLQNEPEDDHGY